MTNPQSWTFLGTTPPPFGGVTVFTKRKVAQLRKQGMPVTLVDISKLGMGQKIRHALGLVFKRRSHGIYLNNLSGYYIAASLCNIGGAQFFYHDHNYDLSHMTGLRGTLFKALLKRAQMVYFDGEHSRKNYIDAGLLGAGKPFEIAPPFIEPDTSEKQNILESYGNNLHQFINSHTPVISANAFKVIQTAEGVDLYGLDMTITLLKTLRQKAPNAGIVFAVAVAEDTLYLNELKARLEADGLTDHFYFFTGTRELWPLFGETDLMVRPTSTDGYGISIAEALFTGTPAVASDVCTRPKGTVLFKARNQRDFEEKVFETLKL